MKKRRTRYFVQPRGSEVWVRIQASELASLKKSHGAKLKLDRHEGSVHELVFIEIEP